MKTILVCLLIFVCCKGFAQNDLQIPPYSNLLYFVDIDADHKGDYLTPYIEWGLRTLTIPFLSENGDRDPRIFDTVRNMDILFSTKGNSKLTDALSPRSARDKKAFYDKLKNNGFSQYDSALASRLYNYQYILLIKINTFQTLLEYQFTLSRINPANTSITEKVKGLPFIDNNSYATASVFIDPASSNYKEKIMQALKQLVTESNINPRPTILASCNVRGDTLYTLVNKDVEMEMMDNDKDSPKDQISYKWDIYYSTSDPRNIFHYRQTDKKIIYKFTKPGKYVVATAAFDGIGGGQIDYYLYAYIKPTVLLSSKDIYYFDNSYNFYSFNKNSYSTSALDVVRKFFKHTASHNNNYRKVNIVVNSVKPFIDDISISEITNKDISDSNYLNIPIQYKIDSVDTLEGKGENRYQCSLHFEKKISDEKYPSHKYYKVKVEANGISNSEILPINYHKLSAFALTFYGSYLFNDHRIQYQGLTNLGVGCKIIATQLISFSPTIVFGMPAKNSTTSFLLSDIIGYKIAGDLNLFTTPYTQLALQFSFFDHSTFSADMKTQTHISQFGIGFSSMLMTYSQNRTVSPVEIFATYYSHISVFNNTVADFYEIGAKFNVYFEKHK